MVNPSQVEGVLASTAYNYLTAKEADERLALYTVATADREDFIFECMQAEGFEYFPQDLNALGWVPKYSLPDDSRAWVDRYGIGYTTIYFHQRQLGAGAVGHVGADPPFIDGSPDDPDARYMASLSPEEYKAYFLTLEGIDITAVAQASAAPGEDQQEMLEHVYSTIDETACRPRANARFPGPPEPTDVERELAQRLQSLPEWVDYQRAGWRCVQDAGIDAFRETDLTHLIAERQSELGLLDGPFSGLTGLEDPLPPDFVAVLAQLQDYERELAALLWDCDIHAIQQRERFSNLVEQATSTE